MSALGVAERISIDRRSLGRGAKEIPFEPARFMRRSRTLGMVFEAIGCHSLPVPLAAGNFALAEPVALIRHVPSE